MPFIHFNIHNFSIQCHVFVEQYRKKWLPGFFPMKNIAIRANYQRCIHFWKLVPFQTVYN